MHLDHRAEPPALDPHEGQVAQGEAGVEFVARVVDDRPRPRVVAHGEIDLATGDQFAEALDAAMATGSSIELDLRNVTFMDSTGIAVLLAARRRLGETPEAIVLVDPHPAVHRIFQLSGIEQLFATLSTPQSVAHAG
jgi:anti-anti-sigma factor